MVCETDGQGGDKTNCHIDLLLLLLTITRCVIFKTHLALLLLLGQGYSTGGLVWATGPSWRTLSNCKLSPTLSTGGHSSQWGAFTDCKLVLTLAFTVSNWLNCHGHLHILFHNAHFRLDHVIFFYLFTQVRCISDWRLGQGSICNIIIMKRHTKFPKLQTCYLISWPWTLNDSKYCHIALIIQFSIIHFFHTIK